jgi:hypothetical protein
MPAIRADLAQRCCRWVRSPGSPPVAFGAGFPALSHKFARPASPRQGSACPFCGAAIGGVESPTPPHGERLPGAVHELTAAQNGRHRRDTRGWMRAARRGTYVGQSVPGWRRLPAIAQVTAYVKMPAGPICKTVGSACRQQCSQGTGQQRTKMDRHSRREQRARSPACAAPQTYKPQVSGHAGTGAVQLGSFTRAPAWRPLRSRRPQRRTTFPRLPGHERRRIRRATGSRSAAQLASRLATNRTIRSAHRRSCRESQHLSPARIRQRGLHPRQRDPAACAPGPDKSRISCAARRPRVGACPPDEESRVVTVTRG